LGGRKGIRPVKNRVVGCWHGSLFGARCRLAYGPADATATLAPVKSRLVLPFWYQLTWVVLEKRPLNGCSVVVVVAWILNIENIQFVLLRSIFITCICYSQHNSNAN